MFTEASNGITSCSRGLLDDVSWNSQWAVWTFSGITSCSREVFDDVSWSSQWIFRWEQWGSEPLRALILILFITLNLHPFVSILKRYKTSDNEYSGLHFPKLHVYKKYMLCLWKICYLNVLYTFQIVMVLFLSCRHLCQKSTQCGVWIVRVTDHRLVQARLRQWGDSLQCDWFLASCFTCNWW